MGFFDHEETVAHGDNRIKGFSVATLQKRGCQVCPLNLQADCKHPQMEPMGTTKPDVYILGDFPDRVADRKDEPFAGQTGDVLRMRIPMTWDHRIRYNNIVRTRTPGDRPPVPFEVECCRPSIVKDIERTQPVAIIGLGPLVLHWATGEGRIDAWTGRRIPIQVGKHRCWFFPVSHPSAVAESRRFEPRNAKTYGSDTEFKFALDMKRALRSIDTLTDPVIHSREDAIKGIEYVTGGGGQKDLDTVFDFLDECDREYVVGLDYETQFLRPYTKGAKILTASLSTGKRTLSFPFSHRSHGWTPEQLRLLNREWAHFLRRSNCRKVAHNLAFENEWSAYTFGKEVIQTNGWDCSMSQAYLLDERQNTNSLDSVCLEHYGFHVKELFDLNKQDMESEKLETILVYNGVDAKYARHIFVRQQMKIKSQGLLKCYEHHVKRVMAATLTTMKGVPVNNKVVEANFKKYADELAWREKEILALPIASKFKTLKKGRVISPSNNNDIVFALQEIAGIRLEQTKNKKRKKEPKEGEINFSTTEEALKKVDHPLAKLVIGWRKASKLMGTYVIPVRRTDTRLSDGKLRETQLFCDNCLHPTVSTCKVRTWRTASEEPNIQNWPKRGPSKVIRRQITVDDDHYIVAIDYAGVQARNVCMESLDKGLLQHYWDRYDIHSDWLERLLKRVPNWMPPKDIGKNLSDKDLHKEQRSVIKNGFVFPSFFGVMAKSLMGPTYLGCDEATAISMHEEFYDEFPDVKGWHERLEKQYHELGYVTGCSGFKRRAPIERNQLINAPIQADEALIVCGAWERLCGLQDERCVPNWMVHDDLSFIWRKKDMDKLLEKVVPVMLEQVHAWERVVPMEIEVSVGQNWCDLKEVHKFETKKGGGWHEIVKKAGDMHSDRWDWKVGNEGVSLARQQG